MKTATLNNILKIVSKISNPSSVTSLYKAVELSELAVRCVSEFGNVHILLQEPSGLKNKVLVDAASLGAISQSLEDDSDITFSEGTNRINWSCKGASGHLNFVQTDYAIPDITHDNFPWAPPKDFGEALVLASCACQAAAVSTGLYGITIEPVDQKIQFLSSNSISLARTTVDRGDYPAQKVTVRPPVPDIIATLLSSCPNCSMDITTDGIFIIGDWLMAQLPLGSELEHDLKTLADAYSSANEVIKIKPAAVKTFVTRAKNLTDKKGGFNVFLRIQEGKLVLEHQGIASSTEEWFLAEGLPATVNYQSVSVSASLLLLPLGSVDTVVLDYLKDQQLVLKGSKPEFTYVLGGGS